MEFDIVDHIECFHCPTLAIVILRDIFRVGPRDTLCLPARSNFCVPLLLKLPYCW